MNGAFVRLGDIDAAGRARLADLGFVPATPPSRIANLSQIGSVPRLLAIALALLGIGGATHGLLVATTKRRADLAVARALGFTPRQAASSVRWQGIVITTAAVVVGVPLGLVVGRLVWKQVAAGVGAVDLVSIPWPMILIAPRRRPRRDGRGGVDHWPSRRSTGTGHGAEKRVTRVER